jgi:hypothetical protein
LTPELAADLGRGLLIISVQKSFRHARVNGGLSAEQLLATKARDYVKLSKGALTFESPSDLHSFAEVIGHDNVKHFFKPIIRQIRTTGKSCKPVCLVGPPAWQR